MSAFELEDWWYVHDTCVPYMGDIPFRCGICGEDVHHMDPFLRIDHITPKGSFGETIIPPRPPARVCGTCGEYMLRYLSYDAKGQLEMTYERKIQLRNLWKALGFYPTTPTELLIYRLQG